MKPVLQILFIYVIFVFTYAQKSYIGVRIGLNAKAFCASHSLGGGKMV